MINTSRTVEIARSWPKTIGILAAGIGLSWCSLDIALHWSPQVRSGSFIEFAGYFGLVFFPAGILAGLFGAIRFRGPLVTLSPEGFRDRRQARSTIPWTAIAEVRLVRIHRRKIIQLKLDPGFTGPLRKGIASMLAGGVLGSFKGIYIASFELAISFAELEALVLAYHRDHRPKS
ncbi:STM3941 family protein [Ensifer adhaerens]|uniref:STM3941 family protein n=1 Tax=Ensifer adhaerens TaxID=106592 RepID=UPI001319DE79|nr:STM3941 family protein [Ensifer adhaerens]